MSVLQIVGAGVGGVAGFFLGGGPVGALQGAMLGSAVGSVANSIINPQRTRTEGARLGDLTVQSSAFGAVRPIGYGKIRVAGNVIWSLPIQEHSSTQTTSAGGGKGGATTTNTSFTYGATFALALCEGPTAGVLRIWANSNLVYDVTSGSDTIRSPGFNFRFYAGDGTQTADSIIEANEGVGNVPGYRGTVYLVFDDIPLANYGNLIPNITVELAFDVTAVQNFVFLTRADPSLFGTPLYSGAVVISPLTQAGYVFADGSVGATGIVEFNAGVMTTTREILMSDVLAPLGIADNGGDNPGGSPMIGPDGALYFVTSDSANGPHIVRVDPNTLLATNSFPALPGDTFTESDFSGAYQLCFLTYSDPAAGVVSQLVAYNQNNNVGGLNADFSFNWLRADLLGSTSVGICQGGSGEGYVMALGAVSGVTFWYIYKMTFGAGGTTVELLSTYQASDFALTAVDFYAPGGQGGLVYDESDDSVVFHVSLIDGASAPFSVTVKWSQISGIIFSAITPSDTLGEPISSPMSRISGGTYARLNLAQPTVTIIDATSGALISNDAWPVQLGGSSATQVYDSELQIIVAFVTDAATSQSGWAKLLLERLGAGDAVLGDIFLDQCERAGFAPSDVDVTELTDAIDGFVISQRAMVSDVLTPLMAAYLIDAVEIDGVLTFRHRGDITNDLNFYQGTWDPATVVGPITLSVGNTVATSPAGSSFATGIVKSTPSTAATELTYFAFSLVSAGNEFWSVGICNAAYVVSDSEWRIGEDAAKNSIGMRYYATPTGLFLGGVEIVTSTALTGPGIIFALQTSTSETWLSTDNGVTWNNGAGDPRTGIGGASISGLGAGPYFAIYKNTVVGLQTDSVQILSPSGFIESGVVRETIQFTEEDLVRVDDNTPVYTEVRQQEIELPMRVTLSYIDSDRDFQVNTQAAKRARNPNPTVQTDNQTDVNIAVVTQATPAKQMAERILASAWSERSSYEVRIPPKFGYLDVTDKAELTLDDGYVVRGRFGKADIGVDYSIDATIIAETAGQYVSVALADPGVPWSGNQTIKAPLGSKLILLDAPLLRDGDDLGGTAMRGYWGGASYLTAGGWPGAQLQSSSDGELFTMADASADEVTWGAIETPPPDPASCWRTQFGATMTVRVTGGTYVPTPTNDLGLANLANPMAVIKANGQVEIIQYRDVTALGSGRYTLGTFYRGVRGTDAMAGALAPGDIFIFLSTVGVREIVVPLAFHNVNEFWRLPTNGAFANSAIPQGFVFHGRDLMPYAPADVSAAVLESGDIVLTWVRRTRFGGELRDGIDTVALNEQSEAYEIDILSGPGGRVLRTLSATSPTATYPSAEVRTDFGTPPTDLSAVIYQMSAVVGRGFGASLGGGLLGSASIPIPPGAVPSVNPASPSVLSNSAGLVVAGQVVATLTATNSPTTWAIVGGSGYFAVTNEAPAYAAPTAGVSAASYPPPGGAVAIAAGANIQAAVDAHSAGTAFLLSSGTYSGQTVTPTAGSSFYGQAGAIMDGGGAVEKAFSGQGVADVTVSGITFQNYAPPSNGIGVLGLDSSASGWVVQACTFTRMSAGPAIMLGAGMVIKDCSVNNNQLAGIGGFEVTGGTIETCDIYANNRSLSVVYSPTGDAAGIKIAACAGVEILNNNIFGNLVCPGIWTDIGCTDTVIKDNILSGNGGPGIIDELDYGITVTGNLIENNNAALGGAGAVYIQNSQNANIGGNYLIGNTGGVWLYQSSRGSGTSGPYVVSNDAIHDNIIQMSAGNHGYDASVASGEVTFSGNAYQLSSAAALVVSGADVTQAEWQSDGNDRGGSFGAVSPGGVLTITDVGAANIVPTTDGALYDVVVNASNAVGASANVSVAVTVFSQAGISGVPVVTPATPSTTAKYSGQVIATLAASNSPTSWAIAGGLGYFAISSGGVLTVTAAGAGAIVPSSGGATYDVVVNATNGIGTSANVNVAVTFSTILVPLGIHLGTYLGGGAGSEGNISGHWDDVKSGFNRTPSILAAVIINSFQDGFATPPDWGGDVGTWTAGNGLPVDGSVVPLLHARFTNGTSTDTDFAGVIAGTYDAPLTGAMDAWKGQVDFTKCYFRINWEFDTNFRGWGVPSSGQVANWKAAYKRWCNVLHTWGNSNGVDVRMVWSPDTSYTTAESSTFSLPVINFFPEPDESAVGGRYIDVIGPDNYMNGYGFSGASALNNGFSTPLASNTNWSLGTFVKMAQTYGCNLGISETGDGSPFDGNASWTDGRMASWATYLNTLANLNPPVPIEYIAVYDVSDGEADQFTGGNLPNMMAGWKSCLGIAGNGSVPPIRTISVI